MMPIRVMGIVRLLVKRAGYKLISDIEILDERTGNRYKSVTRNRGNGNERILFHGSRKAARERTAPIFSEERDCLHTQQDTGL